MRTPGMLRRPVGVALAVVGLALAGAVAAGAQAPTLVFIVRHAEKAATPASDPPLTAAGTARAQALADLLAHANIAAAISTPYVRTLSTAEPLARRAGVAIDTVAIGAGVAAHAEAVAAAVRRHAGRAVLVVGHSNTITAIAAALGAPRLPDLCDEEYDQVFIVELQPQGAPRFVRARYGAASPPAGCRDMQNR